MATPEEFRILVVEADVLIRNLVSTFLNRQGYAVLSAANGEEGLGLLREFPEKIDLLLANACMPAPGGGDLAAYADKERPETRVLLISARTASLLRDIVGRVAPRDYAGQALLSEVLGGKIQHALTASGDSAVTTEI